jgi:beta-lactamase regulating signal transducer with metallopeptidase domain
MRVLRRHSAGARYLIALAALVGVLALAVATFLRLHPPAVAIRSINTPLLTPAPVAPTATTSASRQPISSANWAIPSLSLIWAAGVAALSLRQLAGWALVRRLRSAAMPIDDPRLDSLLAELARRLQISRAVRLAQSSLVQVPTMIGWLDPLILLPLSAVSGLPLPQIRGLLAHELGHVRRYDYLANLIQTGIETLLFYHPAVWWIGHTIRQEREHCCDDIATALCDRATYASALSSMERLRPGPALAVSARGQVLLPRIRRVLQPRQSTPIPKGSWLTAAALTAVIIGGILAAQPRARADAPQTLPDNGYGADVYYINGVKHDGVQTLDSHPIAYRQALLAGGLDGPIAGRALVVFRRNQNGLVSRLSFDLARVMSSALGDQTIDAGDVLSVRENTQPLPPATRPAEIEPVYYVSGAPRSGPYSMEHIAIDLRQALVAAGFNANPATKSLILIRRDQTGADTSQSMAMDQVMNGLAGDMRLQADDILLVRDAPPFSSEYYISGQDVGRPGVYALISDGVSLLQALISAGVDPLKSAADQVIVVRRTNGNNHQTLKFQVSYLLGDGQQPFMLQENDEVMVHRIQP